MYRLVIYPEAHDQIDALPVEALSAYAEVHSVLEIKPWSGEPQHKNNPNAEVRRWIFGPGGAGQVVYLVLEEQQEVHVLKVIWLG